MNYTYVNSQIKVIEEKILKQDAFLKLIKASKDSFLNTLVDLGYGNEGTSVEEIIENELTSVKKYLDEVSPDKELTNLFFLVNDIVNIKYFYKIKLFNLKDTGNFQKNGVFTKEQLKSVILDSNYSIIPKEYQKLFKMIANKVNGINNPRTLSFIIDNTFFEYVLSHMKVRVNTPLHTYYKILIDIKNILCYVRILNLNWKIDNQEFFIIGGNINLEKIKNLFTLKPEEVVKSLRDYYNEKLADILKDYFAVKDLTILELKLNNLLLSEMKKFENDSFGIGVILNYYLKKLAEAENIRSIYANPSIDVSNLLFY